MKLICEHNGNNLSLFNIHRQNPNNIQSPQATCQKAVSARKRKCGKSRTGGSVTQSVPTWGIFVQIQLPSHLVL